ncbi:hypothetical protein E1A91_D03G026100v1 [Gossypium mustelinum]|uniref:Uncharacterized protein n=1 Tax=Gossypium mustelinum TaxID=34275 RepID=A0A5D2VI55_GOSMU|nr:hypothetical protein E1A91_D03G026100v1 [Gossypium mustelinum]
MNSPQFPSAPITPIGCNSHSPPKAPNRDSPNSHFLFRFLPFILSDVSLPSISASSSVHFEEKGR